MISMNTLAICLNTHFGICYGFWPFSRVESQKYRTEENPPED